MGTFDDNRGSMDMTYQTMEDRMAVLLDGKEPAPAPTPAKAVSSPVQAASPAPVSQATGPGFWSRLGSGIAAVASNTVALAQDVASRVEVRGVDGARANAIAQLPPPPKPEPSWGMILGLVAAGIVALVVLFRRA